MSRAFAPAAEWDEQQPRYRRLSVSLGHLDRAEAAAAAGDRGAAAHFFALAEADIVDAVVTAEAVNRLPGRDGQARLMELARRYAGLPEPEGGFGIEFRIAEDAAEVFVWLTLGRRVPWTGSLLPD